MGRKFFFSITFLMFCYISSIKAEGQVEFNEQLRCIENCDKLKVFKDCNEALSDLNNHDGIYLLEGISEGFYTKCDEENGWFKMYKVPNDPEIFGAYCKRERGRAWTIIQRRSNGDVDFYRNWANYSEGFGDLISDYWIGLKRLHKLTNDRDYELWVHMQDYGGYPGTDREYEKFKIGNEENGFKLEFENPSDESFYVKNNGRKFTTYDKDNDELSEKNCAKQRRGAWWYSDCGGIDLNGLNLSEKDYDKAAVLWCENWEFLLPEAKTFKYTHMAITRRGQTLDDDDYDVDYPSVD